MAISLSPPPSPGFQVSRLTPWIMPIGFLAIAYSLLGLTLTQSLSHREIMQRCVLMDPNRARIWSVSNIEIGLAYFGVFVGMVYYFLRTYAQSRRHLTDLGLAVGYLACSFLLDYACVQMLHPFMALFVGDALVMTFTLVVSKQLWFQRLLGIFVPIIFLTCGIGHTLEGMSYWHMTYPINTPWTMVTADIGFAVLVNASRFPAFIRGEDIVAELALANARADHLQVQVDARIRADRKRELAEAARRASDDRFRMLFETMAQGVMYVNQDNRITLANPAALRLLGTTAEEISGRSATDPRWRTLREDGSELPASEAPLTLALRTGKPVTDVICGVFNPDMARTRWLRVNAVPEFPPDAHQPCRAYAMFEDITEWRRIEEERENALQQAVEQAERDSLTALLNHRAFHMRLDQECARIQREGGSGVVVMLDLDNFKFFNDTYGHASGDQVLRQVAACLKAHCRPYDLVARFGGDEFALLLTSQKQVTIEEVEMRLQGDLRELVYRHAETDEYIPIRASVGAALLTCGTAEPKAIRRAALERADERLRLAKTAGMNSEEAARLRRKMQSHIEGFDMLDALVTAVDNKDRYTRRHSEDVMDYSLRIARFLGLSDAMQHTVAVAALLHDVGKIGVPDHILRKPGKLTEEEFEAVKQHAMMGAIMVAAVSGLEETLDAIRHHHERWDGAGYPFGLKGEETPLIARLMAVADSFSAMTTDRPYRKGMRQQDAVALLQSGSGTQWDPTCVDAFVHVLHKSRREVI